MQGAQTTLPIGSIIKERYVVEDLLGKGGFGAVYLVRDQRVRGNLFALKEVIDPNTEDQKRFAFEGEVLERLDHPALPRVYRIFADDSSRVYLLMDYIEGPNLEQVRLKQPDKQMPLVQVMDIMAPIVSAVSYLHQQHPPVIHRDIKPANIIVPNEQSKSVLVDFGIAKEYDQEGTTTAIRRCSPGYGAPEQYARGTNVQTDIYGLAATFYALLTGTIPADALYRMTQMGSKRPDPLEPVSALVPGVPHHVSDAIQRAMAISMNERFSSVDAFWQALHATPLAETPPVSALEDTQPRIAAMPSRQTALHAERSSEPLATRSMPPEASYAAQPVVSVMPVAAAQAQNGAALSPRATLSPERSKRRRRPAMLLLFFIPIALLALIAGLLFETGILPGGHTASTGSTPGIRSSVVPTSTPTATATAKPSPAPTATTAPTVQPTTPPTAAPTAAPPSVVQLHNAYNGTIVDAIGPTSANMQLTNVSQSGTNIQGNFIVSAPLQGSNSFSGSVSSNTVRFTVQPYGGHLPLAFTGTIASNGSISGTYCSVDANGCNDAQGHGTWQVS